MNENKIIEFMKSEDYIPMKAKELAFILGINKKEYSKFKEILDKLEEDYKIVKNRKNKYRINDEKIYEGHYRKNQKGFGFVKADDFENEVYITKNNSLNALNGDIVLFKIIEEETKTKSAEGKIIKIKEHTKNTVVGIFQYNQNFGFVVPDDKSFGTDIFISKNNMGRARSNHKVLVEITKYPEDGKNAEGKVIEILGDVNQAGIDMLSLIKEYDLPYRFPEEVVDEAKSKGEVIDSSEIKNREDFRNLITFTIDGEDAKDLDDAITIEKLTNNNYLLYVHIADVSHYVTQDSLLDKEAYIRGTSIYMMSRVIPMLPRELSNGLCSLNANQDRLSISCIMEIDLKGNVVKSNIVKSIINVNERMNYNDVQKILDNSDKKIIERYKKYINHFKLMEELANILKDKRLKNGYLNLDIPESKIELDKNGYAIDVHKYETNFSNEIIEQFMLTANETVAEKFYWLDAPFIYRVHEKPDIDKIKEANKFLFNFKLKIKATQDNIYPKAFSQVLEEVKGKEEERVVSNLILRTLKLARYEDENLGHFGISSKFYCHFTSPIRRYPDLFIHRVISKYLSNNYNVTDDFINEYKEKAHNAAFESSEREKIATQVEREAEKIKKAEYMEKHIDEEYEGIVSSITSFGMFVELENTVEGLIRFEDMGDEYFIYDEDRKVLIGENSKTTYSVGDKVKIRVKSANKQLRQIDFALI